MVVTSVCRGRGRCEITPVTASVSRFIPKQVIDLSNQRSNSLFRPA